MSVFHIDSDQINKSHSYHILLAIESLKCIIPNTNNFKLNKYFNTKYYLKVG